MKDLLELATTLPSDPGVIGEVVTKVLKALADENGARDGNEAARLLFQEVSTRLLDMIARGDNDKIRDLRDEVRKAQEDADPRSAGLVANMTPLARLQVRMSVLETFIEAYLRSGNLARYFGALAGEGRELKRTVLKSLCGQSREVDISLRRTVMELEQDGLVESVDGKFYTATWAGRDAWRAWSRDDAR